MRVIEEGEFIKIYTQDDWEEFNTALRCTCGHLAIEHEWNFLIGDRHTIQIMGCKKSCRCSQFKIKKKYKYSKTDYSYA